MPNRILSTLRTCLLIVGALAGWPCNLAAEITISPDGSLVTTTGISASGGFTYALSANGRNLLSPSRLGLDFGGAGKLPTTGWSVVSTTTRTVDSVWQPIWGKRTNVPDRYTETTWILNGSGAPFNRFGITLRAYNEGIAIRYSIPADATGVATLATADLTEFQFAGDYTAWFYNGEYHNLGPDLLSTISGTRKPVMTVRAADDAFLAIHEADLRTGAPLELAKSGSTGFQALTAPGSIAPGYVGPWRVIFFGTNPGAMVDSHLIELLNPPPTGDFSWVKPGIGLWDWRADGAKVDGFSYTMALPSWLRMVDFAAAEGLNFVVLDAGWYGPEFNTASNPVNGAMAADVQALIAYARSRNIGIWLYLNDVGGIQYPLTTTLETWASWGAAGVKYGFMTGTQTQKLARTRLITELCAANRLVCNFHDGPVHPYGQARTWPNAVTREFCQAQLDAKRVFQPKTFVTSVFVNMLAGPLDMNNGMFDLRQGPTTRVDNPMEVPSTLVSEAARTLITYSGATILPDIPEYYRKYPELLRFLAAQKMPWRESKTVSGVIGESIVMARQASDGRWLAAAAGNETGRDLEIPLDFLGSGAFQATIIQDGTNAHYLTNRESLQTESRTVIASQTIRVKLAPGGGACILFETLPPSDPPSAFHPGAVWPDDQYAHVNAHGGGILHYQGTYYWFGQHLTTGSAEYGVSVYSSTDLYHWKYERIALPVSDDPASEITQGSSIKRPKVIHNPATGKFVMWFHLERFGEGGSSARSGVAVANEITGPYTYLGSFRPNAGIWPVNATEADQSGTTLARDFAGGQMARDMTLFVDDDGKAYHIHASEDDATLHVSLLSNDYLSPSGRYVRIFPGAYNAAPAMFKHQGKYYLLTSGSTGWVPNPARLAVANSIEGPWSALGNPCAGTAEQINTTFDSQSTFILPVEGKPGAFIFMGDRWQPDHASDSRHVWLPVQFAQNGNPFLQWLDRWDLGFFDATGTIRVWGGGNGTWADASTAGWNGSPPANGYSATINSGTVTASANDQQKSVQLAIGANGTLTDGGNFLNFSGGTLTLNSGTINISRTGDANTSSAAFGSTVTANSGNSTIQSFASGNGIALENGGTTLSGDGNLHVGVKITNHFFNATAGLRKSGSGTLTLAAVNSYTGGTTVNSGVLELSGANAGYGIIRNTVTVNAGAELRATGDDGTGFGWNSTAKINTFNIPGGLVSSVGKTHVWGATVNMTGGELRSNGGVSSATTENYIEWGNNSVNTYASNTPSVISGRLRVRADATTNLLFTVANGAAATDLLVSAAITQTNDFDSTASKKVGLTKAGSGTLALSANNSYTGSTTVNAGVLSLQRASLADTAAVIIASGAKMALDFIGNDRVASVKLGSVTYTTPGKYHAVTYPAFFTGSGSLVIPGSPLDYNSWKTSNGVTGGENDDDDRDGLSNREEYAFGLHPLNAASCSPIVGQLNRETGKFSYTRRVTRKSELIYSIWISSDLNNWTKDSDARDGTPVETGDVESVEVTLSPLAGVPMPEQLFIQVRAN